MGGGECPGGGEGREGGGEGGLEGVGGEARGVKGGRGDSWKRMRWTPHRMGGMEGVEKLGRGTGSGRVGSNRYHMEWWRRRVDQWPP